MKLPHEVTAEQFLEAVRQGVSDAIWRMICQGTNAPCADFYDAIKEGIKDGICKSMPFESDIKNAITDGVKEAWPRSPVDRWTK